MAAGEFLSGGNKEAHKTLGSQTETNSRQEMLDMSTNVTGK